MNEDYKMEDESFDTQDDTFGFPAPPQQRTSKVGPTSSFGTFTRTVGLNTPVASIFTAPRSHIEEVQQEAGRHGLYTGTVYKPRKIKEEESQRWVVLGQDPDAVDRLVDYQKKDVARQLKLESRTTAPVPADATTPKINVTCKGPGIRGMFFPLLSAVLLGGTIIFYMLVYLPN